MKQKIILTGTFLVALLNQPLNAGQVTDTFSQGDLLTDTKMQGIKAAINDNDANVITNRANAANNSTNIAINTGNITNNANLISTLHNSANTVKPVTVCPTPSALSVSLSLSTVVDVASVTITTNSSGVVLVTANTTLRSRDLGGVTTAGWAAGLYVTNASAISSGETVTWEMPVNSVAGDYSAPAHVQGMFTVNAAGTYTYYLTGTLFQTSSSVAMSTVMSRICAVFTPD